MQPDDTRLRKAGRWAGYGAGAGALAYGSLGAIRLKNLAATWRSAPLVGLSGLHGAVRGGAIGGLLGAVTYRKKKVQELSARIDDLIQLESITYHETEAQRHQRKARVHDEKAGAAMALTGYAAAAGTGAVGAPMIREPSVAGIRRAGGYLASKGQKVGGFIQRHPRTLFAGAAYAPAGALIAAYGAHKMGSWRQTKQANAEYMKANEARKKRNAALNGKPIAFESYEQLKKDSEPVIEKTRDKIAESAVENVLEKIRRAGGTKVRLSVKLDRLIEFTEDPRPRNLQGEFQQQGEGGPNPNSMATVYKQPQEQHSPTISAGKFAAATFGGGALGAIGAQAGKSTWAQARKFVKNLAAKRKSMLVK